MAFQQPRGAVCVVPLLSKKATIMEKNLKNENSGAEALSVPPAVEQYSVSAQQEQPVDLSILDRGLRRIFGEDFDISEKYSQDLLLQHLRINKEQNNRLADVLGRDPRLAQMLSDVVGGKRNAHSALARYFGTSMVNVDMDSPEFEEIMLADEERKEEVRRLANDRREYEQNLSESVAVIEKFCEERGYDASDFMDSVWESIVFPVMAGKYSHEVCLALDHALNYDKDVEEAFEAGDIKGRNMNIRRMREDFGDGLPKGMNSVAPETDMKRKRHTLIDKALNA